MFFVVYFIIVIAAAVSVCVCVCVGLLAYSASEACSFRLCVSVWHDDRSTGNEQYVGH